MVTKAILDTFGTFQLELRGEVEMKVKVFIFVLNKERNVVKSFQDFIKSFEIIK